MSKHVKRIIFVILSLLFYMMGHVVSADVSPDYDVLLPPEQEWSFEGFRGTFDRNALKRGYKVYQDICSTCHSAQQLIFRNLSQKGGPEFSDKEVKAIASQYTVEDGPDDFGDMFDRPALPRDAFPDPYPNIQASRFANGGVLPPDLSLIVKSKNRGADYIYAVLTGYREAPKDMKLGASAYYNPFVSGHFTLMPEPLQNHLLEYTDGTEATIEQMSHDVVTFLAWLSEPKMEERKRVGFMTLIYLTIFAGLLYFSMKKIWRNVR